ncbi:MAG: chromate transporter [Burkholderiaceae bacterium]
MTRLLDHSFQATDWLHLFVKYLVLSMLSVGGAISTTSEMHRFLVDQQGWLTQAQFSTSIAIAQAAPGPNVLFVALMGWNVGLNTGSYWAALLGMAITMVGILLPSTTLTYFAANWGHRHRHLRAVRAFKQGMGPVVIGLLLATGWILAATNQDAGTDWALWLLSVVSVLLFWKTRVHVLWLLGIGALLGWFDVV